MIQLLALFLSQFIVVEANLIDGQTVTGELKEVTGERVVLSVQTEERSFPSADVVSLQSSTAVSESTPSIEVQLTDGSSCRASGITISKKGNALIAFASNVPPAECDAELIASARYFPTTNQDLIEQWEEILTARKTDDFLVVNKKGNLDYLAGVINEMDEEQLGFIYGGNQISVPLDRIAGLVFAKRPDKEWTPRATITTTEGSVWQLQSFASTSQSIEFVSSGGARTRLPLSRLKRLEFIQAGRIFLSDLEPVAIEVRPYVPSQVVTKRLEKLLAPRLDSSFDGNLLQIRDANGELQEFEKGMALQSRTELTYRLAGKYQKFQSVVGFDPLAPDYGHIDLRILLDDREVLREEIAKNDPPVNVDLAVGDANRMRILLDFGKNLDIGDRVHLGGAKLIEK